MNPEPGHLGLEESLAPSRANKLDCPWPSAAIFGVSASAHRRSDQSAVALISHPAFSAPAEAVLCGQLWVTSIAAVPFPESGFSVSGQGCFDA
jgi:hypothetical protein